MRISTHRHIYYALLTLVSSLVFMGVRGQDPWLSTLPINGLGYYDYVEVDATTYINFGSNYTVPSNDGSVWVDVHAGVPPGTGFEYPAPKVGSVYATNDIIKTNHGTDWIAGSSFDLYCKVTDNIPILRETSYPNEMMLVDVQTQDISGYIYNAPKQIVLQFTIDVGTNAGRELNRLWVQNDGTLLEGNGTNDINYDAVKLYYETGTSLHFDGTEASENLWGDYGGDPTNNNLWGNNSFNSGTGIPIPSNGVDKLLCYVVIENFNGTLTDGRTAQFKIINDGMNLDQFGLLDALGLVRINEQKNTIALPMGVLTTCPVYSPVCLSAVSFSLAGATPSGGSYSGPGVTSNTFSPFTAGIGTHTITYSPGNQLVAYWNFNGLSITTASSPGSGDVPLNIASDQGSSNISLADWTGLVDDFVGSTINSITPDPEGVSLSLTNNAGNGSYIQIQTSLTGLSNPIITFATRGTSTGFNLGIWSYSIDGSAFTPIAGNTATINTNYGLATADFSGISTLTNAPTVYFRYTLSGATSNGNNRIDNLQINADASVGEPCTFTITVNENPNAPTSSGDQNGCADSPMPILTATATAPSGSTVVWYDAPSAGNLVANPILDNVGTITYYGASYNAISGCYSTFRTAVTLRILPQLTINCPSDIQTCINTLAFDLTGSNPLGGTYSGDGVSSGKFDPSAAGTDTHTITYTYNHSVELLAYWNFNAGYNINNSWPAPISASSGSGSGIITSGNWTWNDPLYSFNYPGSIFNSLNADLPGTSFTLTNNILNGRYIQVEFNMSGLTDLFISYWTQKSGTGFSNNQWSWSTNAGGPYTPFGGVINPSLSPGSIVNITGPAALNGAANVYLRYTLDGSTSTSGNNRIDNLQISAGNPCTNSCDFQVTVNPPSVDGSATAAASSICSGTSTTITVAGYTGTIQWQQSADGTTDWANVTGGSGETTATYTTPNLTATTYYRAVVTSGVCTSANSTSALVTVNPTSVGGTATAAASPICSGTSTTITVTGYTGTIQWQQSANGSNGWANVTGGSGETTATYTTPNLTATTYYRAVVTSGVCPLAYSNVVIITVTPNANITSVTGTTPICINQTTTYNANGVELGGVTGTGAWSSSDILIADIDATGLVTGIAAGICTITYTITGGCGGTVSAQQPLTVNPTPSVSNVFPATVCTGSLFNFTAISTVLPASYSWSRAAVTGISNLESLNNNTATINETLNNTTSSPVNVDYVYTLTAGGCSHQELKEITVVPNPVVTASATPSAVCPGFPFDLYSTSNLGTSQPYDVLPMETFETGTVNTTTGPNGWTTDLPYIQPSGGLISAEQTRWTIRQSPWLTTNPLLPPYFEVTVSSNTNNKFYISDNTRNFTNPSSLLVSPVIPTTNGYTTLTLDFWHYYRDKGPKTGTLWYLLNDSACIDVSRNGGAWETVKVYNQTQGYPDQFAHETVNLSAYVNQTNVRIRFRFQPNSDYYWAIDNVRVTGSSPETGFKWTASPTFTGFPNSYVSPGGIIQPGPGTTTYTATYTDASSGCSGSKSIPVISYDPPAKPIITPAGPLKACTGEQVQFSILSGAGSINQWSLYGSPQASGTDYTTPPLTYFNTAPLPIKFQYVTLVTKDTHGCIAYSDTTKISISDTVKFGTLTSADENICYNGDPSNITFSIGPRGGSGSFIRQWYYQDGLQACPTGTSTLGWTLIPFATGNTYDPPLGLTVSRTYAATVDAIGTPDCGVATWASWCRKVTVNPLPTITTTGIAAAVCSSASAQTTTMPYTATTNNPTSYSIGWNDAANTAGLADQSSTAFPFAAVGGTLIGIVITANTQAGNYSGTMTITNANGCNQTQAVTVTVNPLPTTSPIYHF